MAESKAGTVDLMQSGATANLHGRLGEANQTGGPDGIGTQQPPRGVHGEDPVDRGHTLVDQPPSATPRR